MAAFISDRQYINKYAEEHVEENDAFRGFLMQQDGLAVDAMVHALNDEVAAAIDCTACGGCCRQLMINVTSAEQINMAEHLQLSPDNFKSLYLEESLQGRLIMNSIPCAFLADSKCSVYEQRFAECRAFPHLDQPNFQRRLFGTLIHYAMCPIIFNVIEQLKSLTGFREEKTVAEQDTIQLG